MKFSPAEEAEARRRIDALAAKVHCAGDAARAQKRELDPDGRMTRGDWWAVALLPGPLFSLYAAMIRFRNRKEAP